MTLLHVKSLFDSTVLIVGCGRSGTSLLLSILSAHPEIHCIGTETFILDQPRRFKIPTLDHLHHMYKMIPFIKQYPPIDGFKYICEKTPSNISFLSSILKEFNQNLRVIHLVRDGRDVVTSRHPEQPGQYWISPTRWIEDVSMGLRYDDHKQVIKIYYEDLVSDSNSTLETIMDFLELDYVDNLNEYSKHTAVRNISAWYTSAKPIHTGRVNRWQLPEHKHRIHQFLNTKGAQELLTHLGYT